MLKDARLNDLIKDNSSILAVIIALPVVIILCVISINGYLNATTERDMLSQELVGLRMSADTVRKNEQRLQDKIDNYNQVLGMIIPEKEDYFTIIFALEKISQDTGFNIIKYDITFTDVKNDKLSLDVEGSGDFDAFLTFLRDYQYQGNRLITNEKIELTEANEGRTRLSLNFYHKALSGLAETIKPISQKDVALIDTIESKVSISLKNDLDENAIKSYDTKDNPF